MFNQGHTAVKLSQQSSDRIFQISLGNLAAGDTCMVRVEYVQLLDHISHLLEYTHTATWVPPYTRGSPSGKVSLSTMNDWVLLNVPGCLVK